MFNLKGLPFQAMIDAALSEDLGNYGDLTSDAAVPDSVIGEAVLLAKETGIIAGLPVAEAVFKEVDRNIVVDWLKLDGNRVEAGDVIGYIKGCLQAILTAERTALNFLQRLSGIATISSIYKEAIKGTEAIVLDTRKTTPGFRALEKYAVRLGGASNHRMGLYDMIMIKDNHIDAAGGIQAAVDGVRRMLLERNISVPIEVETRNISEVHYALNAGADRIMLDNMSIDMMTQAVALIAGRAEVEASGNVNLETIRKIAETGVNFISVGALTHSVKALDLSLKIHTV